MFIIILLIISLLFNQSTCNYKLFIIIYIVSITIVSHVNVCHIIIIVIMNNFFN